MLVWALIQVVRRVLVSAARVGHAPIANEKIKTNIEHRTRNIERRSAGAAIDFDKYAAVLILARGG